MAENSSTQNAQIRRFERFCHLIMSDLTLVSCSDFENFHLQFIANLLKIATEIVWDFSKRIKHVFFLKILVCSFEKKLEFLQNLQRWQICSRMSIKWYIIISKNVFFSTLIVSSFGKKIRKFSDLENWKIYEEESILKKKTFASL